MRKLFLIISLFLATEIFAQNYEIESINFIGNEKIQTHFLEEVIVSKENPLALFRWLYTISHTFGNPPEYYDSLVVQKDVKSIVNYYKSQGYFKAEVVYKTEIEQRKIKIDFLIREKERAKISKIERLKYQELDSEILAQISEESLLDSQMFYSADLVKSESFNILSTLKNSGYFLAKFEKPKVVIDTIRNLVNLSLLLKPGGKYKYVEPKVISKNPTENFIDDELTVKLSGVKVKDWYNLREIQLGDARLYRTDLFNSATTKVTNLDSLSKTIELTIETETKLRNDISPEIITNNEDNVFNFGLSVGFLHRNFLGDARKLNLQFSATAQEPEVLLTNFSKIDSLFYGYFDSRLSIEQPFLFDEQIYTKLETYYTIQNRRSEYFSNIFGTKLSLEFTLPKWVFLTGFGANIRFQNSYYVYKSDYVFNLFKNYIINNYPLDEQDELLENLENSDLSNISNSGNNLFIGLNFLKNATNDFLFPTKGYSFSLSIEDGNNLVKAFQSIFTSELPQPGYLKFVGSATYYPSFISTNSKTFGLKLKIGEIYSISGDISNIPLDERLYVGGSNSVRGWRNRELVPNNSEINFGSINPNDFEAIMLRNFSPGGFSLLEGSIEYRTKIIGNFGGTTFIDFGNTWINFSEFTWNQVAIATGFGLRFYTDFFPIRLDFAFKFYDPQNRKSFFQKAIFAETFTFHIGIGEAF